MAAATSPCAPRIWGRIAPWREHAYCPHDLERLRGSGGGVSGIKAADAVSALATALAAAVAVVDCGLVIFGGGRAAAGSLLLDPVSEALAQRLSLGPPPELVVATLGNPAGTLGAAGGGLTAGGRDDVVRS